MAATKTQRAAAPAPAAWKEAERIELVAAIAYRGCVKPPNFDSIVIKPLWNINGVSRYRMNVYSSEIKPGAAFRTFSMAASYFLHVSDAKVTVVSSSPPLPKV